MASVSAGQLTADDIRAARDAIEYYYAQGWTDGLPIVPPIEDFVAEFLAQTAKDPDEMLLEQAHLGRQVRVRDAAINAVMAGCLPEYFPVLVTALEAFQDAGAGRGLLQSTTGQAPLMVVNGPIRNEIGLNYSHNIFGPGDRANSTIGRALRLIILNVLDIRPHDLDQSSHGTPGKYAFCIGEHEELNPWEPLHVELGFPADSSTVFMHMARSDLHVEHRSTQEPREILETIADSMSYAGAIYEAPPYSRNNGCVVVMGPEHAAIVAGGGWSKQDVKEFLWERWGRHVRDLRAFGKVIDLEHEPDDAFISNAPSPDHIKLVVSGADNAGVTTVICGFVHQYGIREIPR